MRRIGLAVVLAVSVILAPVATEAQQATKVPRVGFLLAGLRSGSQGIQPYFGAFRQALHELSYVEGQSIAIEYRSAEGRYERLPDLAAELVRLNAHLGLDGPRRVRVGAVAAGDIIRQLGGRPEAVGASSSSANLRRLRNCSGGDDQEHFSVLG